jgi:hypothetical protein
MKDEIKHIIDIAIKLIGHENVFNYVLEDYIQLRIKEQQDLDQLDKSMGEELQKEFDQNEVEIGKPIQCIKCQIEYCKPSCKYLTAYQKYLIFKKERSKELLREIFK